MTETAPLPTYRARHLFRYEISESNITEVPNRTVTLMTDNEGKEQELELPEILELFENYLRAVGYVPPDDTHLAFVCAIPPVALRAPGVPANDGKIFSSCQEC